MSNVLVKVLKDYRDKLDNNYWKHKTYEYEVSEARAKELSGKGLVEIVKEKVELKDAKEKKEITKPGS